MHIQDIGLYGVSLCSTIITEEPRCFYGINYFLNCVKDPTHKIDQVCPECKKEVPVKLMREAMQKRIASIVHSS